MENQYTDTQSHEHQLSRLALRGSPHPQRMTWKEFDSLCATLARKVDQANGLIHPFDSVYSANAASTTLARGLAQQLEVPMADQAAPRSLIVFARIETDDQLVPWVAHKTLAAQVSPGVSLRPVVSLGETSGKIRFPWERNSDWDLNRSVETMLLHLGEDPSRVGLKDTPRRVVKSWNNLFAGYQQTPAEVLKTQFREEGSDGIVLCKDIEMYSTCEHHLLPFFGKASVAYIPRNGRIVGLSKLARLVEVFSRRLQNQERLTKQVAEALKEALDPLGVAVMVEAEHFCMRARGVQKQNSKMLTSHLIGVFKTDDQLRSELFKLI